MSQVVYWHRELPPLGAEVVGEYDLEATSAHIEGTLDHRDELWHECYRDLMARATDRLEQEVRRLGGDYAHVLNEHVDVRRDTAKGEAWLRGRLTYVLYKTPAGA
jgi:hypothetical protein